MSDRLKQFRRMTDRKFRHYYDIGDYWNALDDAADEIEWLRKLVETAYREGYRAGYDTGKDDGEGWDVDTDWLFSDAIDALGGKDE